MKKFWTFVGGALLGGLIGSALGLVFAPSSGVETRKRVNEYIKLVKNEVENAVQDRAAELREDLETLKKSGS